MKILLLGSTGMLGKAFKKVADSNGHNVLGVARSGADLNIDISSDSSLLNSIIASKPDVIVNTIAITNLNFCEKNPSLAYLINSRPSSLIADYCHENNIQCVYISTDHFFTGDKRLKHDELSPVSLVNEYARTKYIGEKFVLTNPDSLVVRTNIIGFRGIKEKPTFVEWVIDSLKAGNSITAFNDYYTSSIDVVSFSDILLQLIAMESKGLFNIGSSEVSSKMEFIMKTAEVFGYNSYNVEPGTIRSISGPRRAESLGLDVSKVEKETGCKMPNLETVNFNIFNEYGGL